MSDSGRVDIQPNEAHSAGTLPLVREFYRSQPTRQLQWLAALSS